MSTYYVLTAEQLERLLQTHFGRVVQAGELTQPEAELIGGAIKAALNSPEAHDMGICRGDAS